MIANTSLTKPVHFLVMPLKLGRLDWIVTACCMALLGYIVWHMQQGTRGYGYSDQLQAEKFKQEAELANLATRNEQFEAHVRLLRPESVDPDIVDELARRDLALVRPNDRIVRFTD
jgi:cell division protein FtsB